MAIQLRCPKQQPVKSNTMTLVKIRKPNTIPGVFDEFFKEWPTRQNETAAYMPAVNIKEESDHYSIEVHAPGFAKENLSIGVDDNVLTIKGEISQKTELQNERWITREFRIGSFKRSFNLGGKVNTEAIAAQYLNGILIVNLPKLEQEVKRSKEITIA